MVPISPAVIFTPSCQDQSETWGGGGGERERKKESFLLTKARKEVKNLSMQNSNNYCLATERSSAVIDNKGNKLEMALPVNKARKISRHEQ